MAVTTTDARMTLDRATSERDFQAMVIRAAEYFGWLVYHVPDSRRCTSAGFPDLSLVHPVKHRFLVREIKTQKGRLRPEQVLWLAALDDSGVDVGIWRPSDWQSILATLSA